MTVPNRETVRDALVTLLSAALVGVGKPCKSVLGYPAARISASPLVCVSSTTATSEKIAKASWGWQFQFNIEILVRWKDSSSWTQANAEDKLDAIWVIVGGVIEANQSNANWQVLEVVEDTCDLVAISGDSYRREVIRINVGGVRAA